MVDDRVNRYAMDVETLFVAGALGDLGDAQLLERFLEHDRDRQAAERAFAALVDRHGPMVLRVCLGVLGDAHGAQDVSQATFLVLAQRARSVRRRGSVASWLHGVALRLAAKARRGEVRRRSHERWGGEAMMVRRGEQEGPPSAESWPELHEELECLPERYREPIILCHLEGMTQEQAARRLGWPIGTVQSRLARGRDRLRDRLVRRGVTLSAAAFATGAEASAEAAVTAAWVEATARAAVRIAAGRSIAESVPGAVLLLWQSGSRSLLMSRLLIAGGVLVTIGALSAGSAVLGWAAQDRGGLAAPRGDDPRAAQTAREGRAGAGNPQAEPLPSIAGRWAVLYMAGTVDLNGSMSNSRVAYVEPGLIVPITEDTINLPGLTGNDRDPIHYRGSMKYSKGRDGELQVIEMMAPTGSVRSPDRIIRGIYRLTGEHLFLAYDTIGGRPGTFAAAYGPETLLILRRERPAPDPKAAGRIDGFLAPPGVPIKRLRGTP